MNIGTTIRGYRLQKGMSQGDIEKRTGLLRCYLSRVENGHTVPSLETLQKIARALDLQLSEFFAEEVIGKEMSGLNLNEEEIRLPYRGAALLGPSVGQRSPSVVGDGAQVCPNDAQLGGIPPPSPARKSNRYSKIERMAPAKILQPMDLRPKYSNH